MATLIDFSKYVLNRLKIDNLIQDILLGPAYNLIKGTCSRSVELEYHFQQCSNTLTYKLDWNNSKGDRYPFDLSKPLPLQGIEDMVSMLWSPTKVGYDKDALKGEILGVKSVSVKKLHGYGHLEEIVVKRADRQFYKYKEGNFVDQHLNDIEDMLLLAVQHKLFYLIDNDIVGFIVALWVIYEDLTKQKRVMRADELYKFSDRMLKKVHDELHHRIKRCQGESGRLLTKRG
ncbi:hypothetical protein Tco_0349643 [Tanacetum coccineum]